MTAIDRKSLSGQLLAPTLSGEPPKEYRRVLKVSRPASDESATLRLVDALTRANQPYDLICPQNLIRFCWCYRRVHHQSHLRLLHRASAQCSANVGFQGRDAPDRS